MGDRERDQSVDARERALERREAELDERIAERQSILEAAEVRDTDAERRDGIAVTRDRAEDLKAFLDPDDKPYGLDAPGRRHAATARAEAKRDRTHSADDRAKLTQHIGL